MTGHSSKGSPCTFSLLQKSLWHNLRLKQITKHRKLDLAENWVENQIESPFSSP